MPLPVWDTYVESGENIGAMPHVRMLKRQRTYVSSAIEISSSFPQTHDVSELGLSLTMRLKERFIADTVFSQKAQNRGLLT